MSRLFFVFALFISLLAATAAAQESNPAPASQVGATSLPAGERANSLYRAGEASFRDKKFEQAARFFDEAYKLDPSPVLIYNLARAYEEAGQAARAAHYFGVYLARQGDNAPDANEVREKIVRLKAVAQKPPPLDQQVMLASNGGGVPGPAPDPPDTAKMAEARDSGIAHFKKGRFPAAQTKFEEAQGLPGGAKDPVLQLYRAKTAWAMGDVERAFGLVDLAVETAMGKKEEKDILEFSKEIEGVFTLVTFIPSGSGLNKAGLVALTGVINAQKRNQFEKAQGRLATGIMGPQALALPPGEYKVNGTPFTVEAGKPLKVNIPAAVEVATRDPPPATQPLPAPVAERSYLPPWEAWTAFGVAVVATGAATYLGIEATGMAEDANSGSVTERDYPQAKAAFEQRLLGANIAWGVAGAAALTGGVLWWLDATADPTPGTQGDVRIVPTPGGVLMDLSF